MPPSSLCDCVRWTHYIISIQISCQICKFMHNITLDLFPLYQAIKSKCSPDEALLLLKELPNPLNDDDGMEASFNPLKIEVFVVTLLNMGAKSFSHTFAAIAKFHYIFKSLAETQDAQICVLKALYELWKNHQQLLVVVVDKLLKTQIVGCSAVANWLFSPEMSHDFTSFFVWEIMHSTIKKMNKHYSKLARDVDEAKVSHPSQYFPNCSSILNYILLDYPVYLTHSVKNLSMCKLLHFVVLGICTCTSYIYFHSVMNSFVS